MAPSPVIHVLEREDYSKHHLVTLPDDPLPPLAPSSLRIQSKILGLTTNNLTYARMGHLMGWWDLHLLPPNAPAPFNDAQKYGRIAAWGYATILSSTVPEIPAGKTVYGFLPIGTLPLDITVELTDVKDRLKITNPHRQHLWVIYNRMNLHDPLADLEAAHGRDFQGWDALMWGLFATGYNLSKCAFAWDDKLLIHPSGKGDWSKEDADLRGATVVCLAGSGKTGMGFVYSLRKCRPQEYQPEKVIGVCSAMSTNTVEGSGLYDKVVLYDEERETGEEIGKSGGRRIVLVDFGARQGMTTKWTQALEGLGIPFTLVFVGASPVVLKPEEVTKVVMAMGERIVCNASELREKGIESGGAAYLEEWDRDLAEFKNNGGIPGVELKWADGMEAWSEAWGKYCRDEVPASTGLVFNI
ncbi:hypothetical protein BCR34DRAFT_600912 [Clohesyomyces aquaticus]|uniref:Uncharacterized protein n=1 Tax=Clohesyomyces aquaticus TaxID=1231657 RepID=A0A1Y1ZP17_9PLEO|nr:hypothetical protein BCR34DRAFT_600912 [Clohesyomyces aquaticus]